MSRNQEQRRLSAILAADVAGYTRLVEQDTDGTVAAWKSARDEVIHPAISERSGRIVKLTGDGFLAEFSSVQDAVTCAVAIQEQLVEGPLKFRVGIHLGDVVDDGEDIHGEGVNIAARIEALAEPGGINVSGMVFETVRNRVKTGFEDLGEHEVKHVSAPVRVYRVIIGARPPTMEASLRESLVLPDKPSIAVLPFDNLSGDVEQEHFADGMAEDITTGLSKFRWLFVIARTSSFAYKGRAIDVREVARDLGVRYVLEGSIRGAGDRIRVTGQLIDADTANHLWAERYERKLDDIFTVQDEITNAIVQAIAPYIDQRERNRAQRKPPDSLDAWSLYQKGLVAYYTQSEEGLRAAATLFDRSTVRDPEFATAFAYAAAARNRLILNFGVEDRDALIVEVRQRLDTALKLDPWDAIALFVSGILESIEGNHELAVEQVRQALAVNPNSAYIWGILAHVTRGAGQFAEALDASERAMRLSPRDSGLSMFLMQRSASLFYLKRYEECVEWGRRAIEPPAPFPGAFVYLAAALIRVDCPEAAGRVLDDLKHHFPNYSGSAISRLPAGVPADTELPTHVLIAAGLSL